jgi:hypothetical protein
MVHRHGKLAVALLVIGLLAGTAVGQNFQFGGFGMGGGAMLLMNPDVQKELKLSEEQITKSKEVTQSVREKFKDDFAKLKDTPQDQRREKFQELSKSISAATEKGLKDVLNADQQKRLKQLEIQARGAAAFNEADVQNSLKLTDEQKEKIKTINEDIGKEMRETFKGAKDNPQEAFTKIGTLRKDGLEKVVATLNADQKKAWKEMTGEPFEFKFRRPGANKDQ